MNENNQTTGNVELEYADNTEAVLKYEALARLQDNPDFKLVVSDGYLREEAVRLTSLLAVDAMQPYRSQLFESLAAISRFEDYLATVYNVGAPIPDDDDE